jgi:hypothetical protein
MTDDRVGVAARCAGFSSCRLLLGSLVEAETVPPRIRNAFGAAGDASLWSQALGLTQGVAAMPMKKEHLPSVSAKEQRMYEHIKESKRDQGRSMKEAKPIAAATVAKHHNDEDQEPGKSKPSSRYRVVMNWTISLP